MALTTSPRDISAKPIHSS